MKTIALFDNFQDGHHLSYLQIFSRCLLDLGYSVWVFCRESDTLYSWVKTNLPSQIDSLKVFEVETLTPVKVPFLGNFPRTAMVLAEWQYAAYSIRQAIHQIGHSPDLVFFAWLDSYLSPYLLPQLIEWIFPYQWTGLYFTPPHLREGKRNLSVLGKSVSVYNLLYSARCQGLGLLNELEVKQLRGCLNKTVELFPDLTDEAPPDQDYPVAQQIRSSAQGRLVVGLVGGLTRRKGLMTLIEVAQNSQSEDWFFVFVGRLYEHELSLEEQVKIQSFIQSTPSNCFFHFERIPTESQFNAVVEACDVLFAAYENFPFSSNLLAKAAVFEKYIIVSQGYQMAASVEKYHLGLTVPEKNVEGCIKAITSLAKSFSDDTLAIHANFLGYRQQNSEERLKEVFSNLLFNLEG